VLTSIILCLTELLTTIQIWIYLWTCIVRRKLCLLEHHIVKPARQNIHNRHLVSCIAGPLGWKLMSKSHLVKTKQDNVYVTRSLVLYVCFVDRCLSFCTFSFGHCVVCSFSIYGFWLPLWYLQTLLTLCIEWSLPAQSNICLTLSMLFSCSCGNLNLRPQAYSSGCTILDSLYFAVHWYSLNMFTWC
jgi:hypothetical protein